MRVPMRAQAITATWLRHLHAEKHATHHLYGPVTLPGCASAQQGSILAACCRCRFLPCMVVHCVSVKSTLGSVPNITLWLFHRATSPSSVAGAGAGPGAAEHAAAAGKRGAACARAQAPGGAPRQGARQGAQPKTHIMIMCPVRSHCYTLSAYLCMHACMGACHAQYECC